MINSKAGLESSKGGAEGWATRSFAASTGPSQTGFEEDPAIEILEAMGDRFQAGDLAAVRVGAAQLRRRFPDHPYVLREAGRAWINGESPRDAVTDLSRSLQIDPEQADTWFLLAIAHDQLSEPQSCREAVSRAWSLDPDNLQYAAASASLEARDTSDWVRGLNRLIDLHAEHPDDEGIREILGETYLFHAYKDWTVVENDDGGGALVATTRKVLRLAAGGDIAPGLYPTEAAHLKAAAVCLTRLQALGLTDRRLLEQIAELDQSVKAGWSRKLRATWAELGVGGILVLGAVMLLGQSILLAALALLVGGGMIVGSFEPQYRANRIVLSRRGQTLGDAALGLVARHQYGGLAYNVFVMGTYPFIAAYKVYVNWGKGWLARAAIADVTGSRRESAPPAETGRVETTGFLDMGAGPGEPGPVERHDTDAGLDEEASDGRVHNDPVLPTRVASENWRSTATLVAGSRRRARLPALPPVAWAGIAAVIVAAVALAGWATLRPRSGDVTLATSASRSPGARALVTVDTSAEATPVTVRGSPTVTDTATLIIDGATISLDGITGEAGVPAQEMAQFVAKQGGSVSCEGLPNGLYRCRTPSGYDIAAAALFNGAARVSTSASAEYRKLQSDAQAARKGFWQ